MQLHSHHVLHSLLSWLHLGLCLWQGRERAFGKYGAQSQWKAKLSLDTKTVSNDMKWLGHSCKIWMWGVDDACGRYLRWIVQGAGVAVSLPVSLGAWVSTCVGEGGQHRAQGLRGGMRSCILWSSDSFFCGGGAFSRWDTGDPGKQLSQVFWEILMKNGDWRLLYGNSLWNKHQWKYKAVLCLEIILQCD